jgi:hypothetical protein
MTEVVVRKAIPFFFTHCVPPLPILSSCFFSSSVGLFKRHMGWSPHKRGHPTNFSKKIKYFHEFLFRNGKWYLYTFIRSAGLIYMGSKYMDLTLIMSVCTMYFLKWVCANNTTLLQYNKVVSDIKGFTIFSTNRHSSLHGTNYLSY